MQFRLTKIFLSFLLFCSTSQVGQAQENSRSRTLQVVADALHQADRGESNYRKAKERLESIDAKQLIPIMLQLLKNGRLRVESRILAYTMLVALDASESPDGRAQLIAGLKDSVPEIHDICYKGLDPTIVKQELTRLTSEAADIDSPDDARRVALRQLGVWGEKATPSLEAIASIVVDDSLDNKFRTTAFDAFIRIGGLARGFELYERGESIGEEVIVLPLAGYFVKKLKHDLDQFDVSPEDLEYLEATRSLVIGAMTNPDRDLREAAFESLMFVYGRGFLVAAENGTQVANPSFVDAITQMAANEPDEQLRARAQSVVETLDERVRKAIRRRERRQTAPRDEDR